MTDPANKAVFLSYASQDAEVARGIAGTLRSAGIEVWLDQAELVGGDAWDRKIRQQIQSCALFVPIISANTQGRIEGYFRLEWRLAEQRSFRMDKGSPFLFPVVIDATPSAQARVPESFTEVQWTRLGDGGIPADFAARVKALLDGGVVPIGAEPAGARAQSVSQAAAHRPLAPDDKSIAVLAFADMSPQRDQEYFSDGIAEELLNLLTKITQLRVIARTSSFSFKGQNVPIAEIARQLNVAHVLEGSVRKAGNKVRVTAQLIRAADSTHLWSETYDRPLYDIFAVQDEIAAEVVSELKIKLLGAVPKATETDPEAYALYLQALQLCRQGSAAGFSQAHALATRVLAIDPAYVAAWDLQASIYFQQAIKALIPVGAGFRQSREAAQRALALDPGYAPAHASVGMVALVRERDLAEAARHLQRALDLAPGDPTILELAAVLTVCLGRLDQAIRVRQCMLARDPTSARTHFRLGLSYICAGRPTEAVVSLGTAVALSPGMLAAQSQVGLALLQDGQLEASLEAAQKEPSEDWRLIAVTMILHALGRHAESDAALAETIDKYAAGSAFNIAYVLAYRGEADRAFEWLDKAVEANDPGLADIVTQPEFRALYDDPRWLPFLTRIGMAPDQLAAIDFEINLPR